MRSQVFHTISFSFDNKCIAFDTLYGCLEYLFEHDELLRDQKKLLVQGLKEAKRFFMSDYRIHIRTESPVAEYSILHGLNCNSKANDAFRTPIRE
jgi:hypothetical protein